MENELTDKVLADRASAAASGDAFANLAAVLKYLKNEGFKIGQSRLYDHRKEGKLVSDADGTFSRKNVDKYARIFLKQSATGKRIGEAADDMQRDIMAQQKRLNELKIKREQRRNDIEEKKYLSAHDVRSAAYAKARQTRDAILNIPDRIGAIVAAESDSTKVIDIMKQELTNALEELSESNACSNL